MNIRNIIDTIKGSYLGTAFGYLSLAQAVNGVTNFGLMTLYTKVLPPAEYGKISIIWLFITILSMLIDGRLNTAFCIRFYKNTKEENTINLYTIFVYNFAVFLFAYSVLIISPHFVSKILNVSLTSTDLHYICFIAMFMLLNNFFNAFLMVSQQPKRYFQVCLFFNAILVLFSMVLLLGLKYGYMAYLKSYLVGYFSVSVLGMRHFLTNYSPQKGRFFSLVKLRQLLRIGYPLVPDGLMYLLLAWAGRYILNIYSGLAVVGIYSVASIFSSVFNNFIVTPFGQAVTPLLFKKYASSREEYGDQLGLIFKYYWLVMFTLIVGYFSVLREVFQLFVGAKYIEGYYLVAPIVIGITMSGATNLLGASIILKEKTSKMFMLTSISVALNITLNMVLVPRIGMYGTAIAILLSYVAQFSLVLFYSQKLVHVHYNYPFILKYSLVALTVVGVLITISQLGSGFDVEKTALKLVIFCGYLAVVVKTTKMIPKLQELFVRS